MEKKDKRLYNRLVEIIVADGNWDDPQKRFITDLNEGFLFYYPNTGKILLSKKPYLKTVFRDKNTCFMLRDDIKKIINQLYRYEL